MDLSFDLLLFHIFAEIPSRLLYSVVYIHICSALYRWRCDESHRTWYFIILVIHYV